MKKKKVKKKKLQIGAYVTRRHGKIFRPFAVRKADGVKIGLADGELNVIVMPRYELLYVDDDTATACFKDSVNEGISCFESHGPEYDEWYIDLNTGLIVSCGLCKEMNSGCEDWVARWTEKGILADMDWLRESEEGMGQLETANAPVFADPDEMEEEISDMYDSEYVYSDKYLYGVKDEIADFVVMPDRPGYILESHSDDEWSEVVGGIKRRLKVGC